jgi:hypothetical protein
MLYQEKSGNPGATQSSFEIQAEHFKSSRTNHSQLLYPFYFS